MSVDLEFLKRMPKADLHVHIDGSVRTETILDLARAKGFPLPASDVEGLAEHVTVRPGCRSLAEFLETFEVFYPLLKDPEALERIAFELIADEAADGVRYVEARFAPVLQATEAFPVREVVRTALGGLNAGAREAGIECGLICCCYRSEPPSSSLETVKAALEFRSDGVVGLDLAGDEKSFPALPHLEAFIMARDAGLPVTIHAGETGPCGHVQEGVFLFGANRLGHAIRLAEDETLTAYAARESIAVEVCLTSNVKTGAIPSPESYPLRRFLEAGVPVTLNSDDPAVFRTTLSQEYAFAARTFDLEESEIRRIARQGFASAFAPESRSRELVREFERWFDEQDR
jgi:adenosine deaminase